MTLAQAQPRYCAYNRGLWASLSHKPGYRMYIKIIIALRILSRPSWTKFAQELIVSCSIQSSLSLARKMLSLDGSDHVGICLRSSCISRVVDHWSGRQTTSLVDITRSAKRSWTWSLTGLVSVPPLVCNVMSDRTLRHAAQSQLFSW